MRNFIKITPQDLKIDTATKIIKRDHYSHYLDAQEIIFQAEHQAKKILAQAEEDKKIACDKGYQAGYRVAKQEQSEIYLATLGLCQKFLEEKQHDILDIALDITRKILGELDNDTRVLKLIEQALATHYNIKQLTLRVAPEQYEVVNDRLTSLLKTGQKMDQLEVRLTRDKSVAPGNCLLDTPIGVLSANVEAQIAAIENTLKIAVDGD